LPYRERILNARSFQLSSLVTHFKIQHLPQNPRMDWTKDMIEQPDPEIVTTLIRSPGMDDEKLRLIAAAFPLSFTTPLPRIGEIRELETTGSGLANRLLGKVTNTNQGSKKKKKGRNASSGTPAREQSEPLARDDEYDPRRPAFLQQTDDQPPDLSRFDTDAPRTASAGGAPLNFSPETLAALSSLVPQIHQPPTYDARDRSPSVGARSPPRPPPASVDVSNVNFAAILSALQQPQQPQHQHVHYSGPAGDLQAAMAHNAQHYEQNRSYVPQTYAAPAPAPPPPQQQGGGYYSGGWVEEPVFVDENGNRIYPVRY
jgi:hypothetical protein